MGKMKYKLIDLQGSGWYENTFFGTLKEIKESLLYRMECAGELDGWTKTEIRTITPYSLAEFLEFEIIKLKKGN